VRRNSRSGDEALDLPARSPVCQSTCTAGRRFGEGRAETLYWTCHQAATHKKIAFARSSITHTSKCQHSKAEEPDWLFRPYPPLHHDYDTASCGERDGVRGILCSMQLFEDDSGGNEARKTRAHNAVRGPGIVADLKEARDRGLMGRS
jgi:hypothetical protein